MKTLFINLEDRKIIYAIEGYIQLDKIKETIQSDKKLRKAIKKSNCICGIVTTEKNILKGITGIVEYQDGKIFDLEKGYFYVDTAEWDNRIDINNALAIMGYNTRT